jgi:uncharacterized SAM-binding protein YcdF (DUF218 family)
VGLLTHTLLSPLGLGALLFVFAVLFWRWLGRVARVGLVAIGAILLALSTPLGANALIRLQEMRAPAADACTPAPDTIVVLAGGTAHPPRDANDFAALNAASLQRLFAAVALYDAGRGTTLAIVGTSDYDVPDSEVMAALATRLGVPRAAIRVETSSLTTWQNAERAAALSPPIARRIWLVTSAVHMPRALYAFRAAAFDPCAWPAYSQYRGPGGLAYLLPYGGAAAKAEDAIHEIAGEIAYRLGLRADHEVPAE